LSVGERSENAMDRAVDAFLEWRDARSRGTDSGFHASFPPRGRVADAAAAAAKDAAVMG